MKKIIALLLAMVMMLSFAACGSDEPGEEAGEYAVAMVTDYGDITDQSFNQTTYEACKEFSEAEGLNFEYFKPASDSDEDRVSQIENAIDNGYNVIVLPGFAFAKAVKAVAYDYPEVTFIALDVSEFDLVGEDGWEIPENVYSAVYQEELSGYMAGYAAVKLGYTKIGYLGGMQVPAVLRFGYGFLQGADDAAVELGLTDVVVDWAYGNQFYGDADITAAMDTWYGAGTEIVFACGGGIYTSAAEAAQKVGGKVIGVDVDQALVIDPVYGEGMTVTSAMKGLAPSVKATLAKVLSGEFVGGQVENLGLVSEVPEDNFVQLAPSTQFGEGFTEDDYKALVAAMFNGEVVVSNDIAITPAENVSVITVNDLGNIK